MTEWGLELFIGDQYEEASRVFQQVIAENIQPENRSTILFYLAGSLEMDDKTDEAIEAVEKAVELAEESPRIRSRKAWILYHAGRQEAAEKAYAELLEEFDGKHSSPVLREVMRDARLVLSNLCVQMERMPEAILRNLSWSSWLPGDQLQQLEVRNEELESKFSDVTKANLS